MLRTKLVHTRVLRPAAALAETMERVSWSGDGCVWGLSAAGRQRVPLWNFQWRDPEVQRFVAGGACDKQGRAGGCHKQS